MIYTQVVFQCWNFFTIVFSFFLYRDVCLIIFLWTCSLKLLKEKLSLFLIFFSWVI